MDKKSGFVTIIGEPNSGKSTLMNKILGLELSIVTPKPQTTRNKIFGIYTKGNIQVVFVDTPGFLNPSYRLQNYMERETESSFLEADVVLLVVDSSKYDSTFIKNTINKYSKFLKKHIVFCVLNKIDLITKEELLHIIDDASKAYDFEEIIPVSAKKGFSVSKVMTLVEKYLKQNDFYFDSDSYASQPVKFFVSEIIRKYALKLYSEEVPFSIFVDIDEFKERKRGKDYIRASIILEKESQKRIVIGQKGTMIKQLGESSRQEIEEFLGHEVFLELFVKVKKNWKNDEAFLKGRFGSYKMTE